MNTWFKDKADWIVTRFMAREWRVGWLSIDIETALQDAYQRGRDEREKELRRQDEHSQKDS